MSESNTLQDSEQTEQEAGDPPPPPDPEVETSNPSRPYPRYVGQYTRKDGYTIHRTTDGQTLKAVPRPPHKVTKSKAKFYLVDGNTGGYVSSLWGREFEHDGIRYTIGYSSAPGHFEVSVKDGRGSR